MDKIEAGADLVWTITSYLFKIFPHAVIGYLSWQDGAILPSWDYLLYPTRKPYNKLFIDQVCCVKMARYWTHLFMDLDFVWPRLGP